MQLIVFLDRVEKQGQAFVDISSYLFDQYSLFFGKQWFKAIRWLHKSVV